MGWVPIYAFMSYLPQMIVIVHKSYSGHFSVAAVQV
jgi:hypothetical protein